MELNAHLHMPNFLWECIYHLDLGKCKLYLRYIDDITLDELNKFIAKINQVRPSIKFDVNYSSSSVNFLDTTVKNLPWANFQSHLKRKQIVKLNFKENQNTWSL